MSRTGSTRGFTLVELLITLALLAIVAAVAVPNFSQFIRKNQLESKANELKSFLLLARNEAIGKRAQVKLVFSASNPWEIQLPSRSDEVIRKLEHNASQAKLVAMNSSGSAITELHFRPSGVASAAARFTVCHNGTPTTAYLVSIAPSGSIRVHPQGKAYDDSAALAACE